ncbi:restriction endonuclease subunit S, partial [Escherichia coli]|nr:restriction endonuclease subunit S [Escherichia coli]
PQNDVTLKMPAFEWVHVQLHQQKGMISLSPPTICNSAGGTGDVKITTRDCYLTNLSIKINLDETKVRKEYFYYLFLQSNLRYLDSGSAQSQITINDLANVEISAPSLNVQDLIVKSLKAFDDKITTLSSMNQTLEQMSQTLFKSWFVDFDPVIDNALDAGNPIPEALQTRAKLRQKVRNSADFKPLPAEIRSLFPSEFEETELGWVPKGWKEGTLPEIAFINSTSWTNKNQPDYINYVDLSNAKDGRIYSIEKLSFNDAPSRARRILKKDDLIFGLVRPANRSFAYVHVDGLTGSTGFAVIRAQKTIYKNFIYYFVTYDKNIEELARIADGGAYPAIKPDDICTLPLIIPSINIIEKFDELTSNFREMMNNSLIQNEYLTNLRGTLLPKLISGELSLEDLPDLTTDTEAA